MANRDGYFKDLHVLLKAMPPGTIDMDLVEVNEQRYGHRYADPPEIVQRWLLDEQRRAQAV